jgi:hypothetical protein
MMQLTYTSLARAKDWADRFEDAGGRFVRHGNGVQAVAAFPDSAGSAEAGLVLALPQAMSAELRAAVCCIAAARC